MWTDSFESMMWFMLMAAMLRMSYELSRPNESAVSSNTLLASTAELASRPSSEMTPWQKEASERAVKEYAASQGKKWRKWDAAMFEPKNAEP